MGISNIVFSSFLNLQHIINLINDWINTLLADTLVCWRSAREALNSSHSDVDLIKLLKYFVIWSFCKKFLRIKPNEPG